MRSEVAEGCWMCAVTMETKTLQAALGLRGGQEPAIPSEAYLTINHFSDR